MCVAYFDEPVTPTDISVTIRFDPATVTRAAQRLVERDMLEKVDNFQDSRSALLSLTDAGRDVADSFRQRSAEALAAAGQHMTMILTENEKSELLRLLLKMRNRSMEFASLKNLDIAELGDSPERENVVEFFQERADRA
jgi:DNA-binding MarR family transcriptional regulator